jgi:hypothetical protein
MVARSTIRCLIAAMFVVIAGRAVPGRAENVLLHVSTNGDDRATGSATEHLATPHRAVELLAGLANKSPDAQVQIVMHGGVYRIEKPLIIGPPDVPLRGSVTLAAAEGELVVISGGKRISGWTNNNDGTWSAAVPKSDQDAASFRELFVGGARRPRARHPNAGYARVVQAFADKRSGFVCQPGDFPENWYEGGELVFLHDWSTSRIPVLSVTHDTHRLTVAFPIGNRAEHYKIDHFEPHPRYYVENHRAFLDSPGEWLLEDGRLTYRPMPGEQPGSVEATAPYATQLVRVVGSDDHAVRNVHIRGLHMEHCAWRLPPKGYAGSQATAYEQRGERGPSAPRSFLPAAIEFIRAEDCSFTSGRIAHLGTTGIHFGSRTRRCRLSDSVLEDISANGVNLGEDSSRLVDGRPWWQSAADQAAAGHVVEHNRIEWCGQQFFGAVAVWVGLARDMQIVHNEIAHHPYTGVSVGWMWNPTPTPAGDNVVAHNHIHHVMQVLSDGGGIYTLGRQPGTRLIGNVIHDVPLNAGRAESNGMFLDEGSDQIEIAANVVYGVTRSPLRFHKAQQMIVRGNTLITSTANTPPMRYNNTRPETIKQVDNRVLPQAGFDAATIKVPETGPRHRPDVSR